MNSTARPWLRYARRQLLPTLAYSPRFIRDYVFCQWHGLSWHSSWRFLGLPLVSVGRKASVEIGRKFTACSDPRRNSLGVFQKVTIKVGGAGRLTIGEHVAVSGCSISVSTSIRIGSHVLLGSGCMLTDSDAHPVDPGERRAGGRPASRGIVVEDDVFVGARAIILKGVTIGQGSVIGAGAVVATSVPPYSVCVGNPARIVGDSRAR